MILRTLILACLLLLAAAPAGATSKTRATLMSDVTTAATSNAAGQISGSALRTLLNDMVDSMGVQLSANTWNAQNIFNGSATGISSSGVSYTSLGTGARAWNVQDALHAQWLLADGFSGVDPTGVVESTIGVQAALNAATPGTTVYFGGKYYVGNLTVPDHVTIECGLSYPDPLITAFVGTLQNPYDWKGQFRQKIGTTITTASGANGGRIHACLLIREGLTLPVTTPAGATTLLTQMSGTGISVVSSSFELDHVAMFGHNIPISSINPGGVAISNRVKIYDSIFDNLNGPVLTDSGDPVFVEHNHIFSALTMAIPDSGPAGTTPAIYERPGTGLTLDNHLTESRISENVIFGYFMGVAGTALSQNQIVGNRVEFPPSSTINSTGISIEGSQDKIDRNFVIGFTYPYVVSSGAEPDGNNLNTVTNNTAICKPLGGQGGASAFGFRIDAGRFDLSTNQIQNCSAGPGIRIQPGVLGGHIGFNTYSNTPTHVENNSAVVMDSLLDGSGRFALGRDKANSTVDIGSVEPSVGLYDSDSPIDEKYWEMVSSGSVLVFRALNDAYSAANTWMTVAKTGFVPSLVTIVPQLKLNTTPIFSTLTGYLKGNGVGALTAAATVPLGDISGLGAGVATFLATPSSANLAAAVTDETGTGAAVFADSPALTGNPTAPTQAANDNSTKLATTAYADAVSIATPASINATPGIQFRYDTSCLVDNSTTACGTVVSGAASQLTDLSGNANHAVQSTASARPTLQTAAQNGLNTLRWTAANSQLMTLTTPITASDYTTIAVKRRAGPAGANSIVLVGHTTNTALMCAWDSTGVVTVYGNNQSYTTPVLPTTNYVVFSTSKTTNLALASVLGNSIPLTGPSAIALTTTYDNIGSVGATFSNGDIAEVVVFNRVLARHEREPIERYLAKKWNAITL